jgi:predicted peptidase
MDQHNLIFIAANQSGNRVPVTRRMVMALMGLKALESFILVDSTRISVSGFSGGGRVASMLASQYPEVFTGALYICGVNFWQEELNPRVEQLVRNRFVFLTGTRDFNRDETQNVYRQYLEAGAVNSKLMIIPSMGHERPDGAAMAEAMDFIYGAVDAESEPSVKGAEK